MSEHPEPTLRDLLERVASGDLAADDAARLLYGTGPVGSARPATPASAVDAKPARVLIHSDALDLRIEADPSVAVIDIEGPHQLRTEGDTLVVDRPGIEASGSFRFGRTVSSLINRDSYRVTVRINPDLPLRIEGRASNVRITDVTAPIALRLSASAIKAFGVEGPLDCDVSSSSLKVEMLARAGESKFRGQMSSVEVRLTRGSNATITANSDMGSAAIKGAPSVKTNMGETVTATIGKPDASLDFRMLMGSIKVVLP